MTKPKKSSTGLKPGSSTREKSLIVPSALRETWTIMRRTEAREWLRRYRMKAGREGAAVARAWWAGVIGDIEKIRGKEAANELRYWMNQEK